VTDEPHPPWIDKQANVAGHLGMNATGVRWKLIRWHDRRTKARAQPPLASRPLHVMRRLGLSSPEAWSLSTLLALAIMATYARVWVAQGGGFGAPAGSLVFDFGGHWQAGAPEERWRLLTAVFLHFGLWHLAFNLIAIANVGPQIETIWGRLAMLFVFVATGVIGNIGSGLMQPNVLSAGASGGVCGLIGAAAGYGHRLGTPRGLELRNDMIKWLAYTIVFGFAIGANNWAHGFGAASGVAFGYAVQPARWNARALRPLRVLLQAMGIAATVAALAIIFTRSPAPPLATTEQLHRGICDMYASGNTAGAISLFDLEFVSPSQGFTEDHVIALCSRR
jgi:membrane associated rhomboid family serine protease